LVLLPDALPATSVATVRATLYPAALRLTGTVSIDAKHLLAATEATASATAIIAAGEALTIGLADTLSIGAFILHTFTTPTVPATTVVTANETFTLGLADVERRVLRLNLRRHHFSAGLENHGVADNLGPSRVHWVTSTLATENY